MLAAAVAIVVAGLVLSLFLGFFGLIVSAVGVVLFILWLISFRRTDPAPPPPSP
jgi:dolichol kinase